ncbi:MAG: J domain-containing protein [Magnetovibrio sp.]|nr:J domain-containing protein [Magnetovibrio sp.]
MKETTQKAEKKHSYTVPCTSIFRDAVVELAGRKNCNVADLARSVVLVVPGGVIKNYPDPGGPARDDRETVVLKSGKSKGKPWRRKPRLQVRMPTGFAIETIRKALALAFAIEDGDMCVGVQSSTDKQVAAKNQADQEGLLREADAALHKTHDEHERMRTIIKTLYFEPVEGGVVTQEQAFYVMGFAPGDIPDARDLRQRFRRLATVYHPDGKMGCHERMSQLNTAMDLLR